MRAVSFARKDHFAPDSKYRKVIKKIITGSHLTFRYILLTALLAKATEENINPIALQASADIEGAYDARSLCHNVIVPNEAKLLDNALGASNEPFLNKPARFPTISVDNAVRKGKDHAYLVDLHNLLIIVDNGKLAFELLVECIYFALEKNLIKKAELNNKIESIQGDTSDILNLIFEFTSKSIYGETSVLVIGALLMLFNRNLGRNWDINIHPVNQAGSSSREICDIDVFENNKAKMLIEVKDKKYKMSDIEHAARKVKESGNNVLHFIEGPHARCVDWDVQKTVLTIKSITVFMHRLTLFSQYILSLSNAEDSFTEFVKDLATIADKARVKDETRAYLIRCLEQQRIIN